MRDDFSDNVKRIVEKRVGGRCSRPECRARTSGPQSNHSKALNVGVAAHITAASPSGPRYNANLSAKERRSADNAIWLCQNCAKLVDNDPIRYPETLLRDWKDCAEDEALNEIGKAREPTQSGRQSTQQSNGYSGVFNLPRSSTEEVTKISERLHMSTLEYVCIENALCRQWIFDPTSRTANLFFFKEGVQSPSFRIAMAKADVQTLKEYHGETGYWNLASLELSQRGSLKLQMEVGGHEFLTFYWTNYAINHLLETIVRQFSGDWDWNVSLGRIELGTLDETELG